MARIAIIGGGNIGEALLAGLLRAGRHVRDIVVAEKAPARARALAEAHSVQVTGLAAAVDNADFVVVAVKPADIAAVVGELGDALAAADQDSAEQVVVSVAAGVSTAFYESSLPAGTPVIRVMPNAPMMVGAGVSAMVRGRFATAEQARDVAELFDAVGAVLTVGEQQIDAVTAVSGSGPAYFFLMVEALVDAAVAHGLGRAVATDLAVQTMAGSAAMLLERLDADRADSEPAAPTGHHDTTPAQLRALVTSPGGTTAAGLQALERAGLRTAVAEAVQAARSRSAELGITAE